MGVFKSKAENYLLKHMSPVQSVLKNVLFFLENAAKNKVQTVISEKAEQ